MKKNKKKLPRYWLGTMRPTSTGYQQARGLGDATFKTEQPLENLGAAVKIANSQQLPLAIQKASTNIINPALQYSKYLNRYSPQNYNSNPGIDYAKYGIIDTAATSIGSGATGAVSAAPTMAAARGLGQTKATLDAMRSAAGIGQSSAAGATSSAPWIEGLATTGPLANATPNAIGSTASITTNAAEQVGEKTAEKVATSGAGKLGDMMLGKILPAVGTVYGVGTVASDIVNSKIPGVTQQQLRDSSPTNIYTTSGGNTYKEYAGVDSRNALELERIAKRQKQVGLAIDAAGLGMSAGALAGTLGAFGSVLGPWGSVIGLGAGALLGGLASAIGFGDNEDKVRQMIKDQQDVFALQNWQSEATAKDRDVKQAFAEGYGAANGKAPVWTPAGLFNKKATARVSNGEVVGNFADGIATRIPGKKNNKDTKLASLKDGDFVISNKYGLSDYAAATGDYAGALNLQEMLLGGMRNNKGYKNGKLPKFNIGTWQYANAIFPHAFGYLKNYELLNRVESSDRTAPQTQVPDAGASRAIDDMYTDRIDERDYLRQAYDLYRQQLWESRRTPGIGLGGRMLYATNLGTQTQRQLADTRLKINEQNRAQRNAARQMQLQNALNIRAHELDNFWKTAAMRQQINSAYEKYRAQIPLNQYNILSSLGSNLSQIYNTNNALDIQNRMLKLYEQDAETDKRKADAWINSLGNNTTSTANPIKAYDTIKNLYSNLIPTKFGNIRIA